MISLQTATFLSKNCCFLGEIHYFCTLVMMNWQHLISNKRLGQEHRHPERHDDRTEFKRDYDRLIFSAPFRRLQNKTQVFPLPGSVFVHNRLTHSLEVASVGMSLGNDVAQQLTIRHPELKDTLFQEIEQIVATACLAHDLGNPPFGHSGEKAIESFFIEGAGSDLQSTATSAVIILGATDSLTHSSFSVLNSRKGSLQRLEHEFAGLLPIKQHHPFCLSLRTVVYVATGDVVAVAEIAEPL